VFVADNTARCVFRDVNSVTTAKGAPAALVSALLLERSQKADFQLAYSFTLGKHLDYNTR
jgi:hypothetical protein